MGKKNPHKLKTKKSVEMAQNFFFFCWNNNAYFYILEFKPSA